MKYISSHDADVTIHAMAGGGPFREAPLSDKGIVERIAVRGIDSSQAGEIGVVATQPLCPKLAGRRPIPV